MIDDQFTPLEEELIRHIQAAARPKLNPGVRDAIRQQMLREFRTIPSQPRWIPFRVAWAAAAVIVVIGFIMLFLANQPRVTMIAAPTSNIVAAAPSETPLATSETPTVMPTPTLMATTLLPTEPNTSTTTSDTVLIIEGPVTNITDHSVTVYDFNIQVEPQHPILNVIEIGDVVRVQGVLGSDGQVVASVIGNITSDTVVSTGEPTVGLDGPVESIENNMIVVNDIPVQLKPDDPLLKTLQVGNFVRVQGNFETSDTTIVLVVVNIVVKNAPAVENDCWYHEDAMGMGHWHCNDVGLGMGENGMGTANTGMGENGMGNDIGDNGGGDSGMSDNGMEASDNNGMGTGDNGMGMGDPKNN
jgi:uncharacterized protein DUF5666